jgi:predicted metal-dependent enzyme (double-stranded beta helix superfamily)
MFDLDAFLDDCITASREAEPRTAIKDVLARAMARPADVGVALPPERAGIERLHVSDELTVLKVVWAPGMSLGPHDHRMWAAIGLYSGGEDNAFFRRDGSGLVASGGRELRTGDVCLLGDDAVHGVTNPTKEFAGAIHIYGGDFFAMPRSEWMGEPLHEQPYDVGRVLEVFEAANAAHFTENANSRQ